jgi:hypothetical protein
MNNLSLTLTHATKNDANTMKTDRKLVQASISILDAGAFSALTSKVWCGFGGLAGFDDSPVRRVCPGYSQLN